MTILSTHYLTHNIDIKYTQGPQRTGTFAHIDLATVTTRNFEHFEIDFEIDVEINALESFNFYQIPSNHHIVYVKINPRSVIQFMLTVYILVAKFGYRK